MADIPVLLVTVPTLRQTAACSCLQGEVLPVAACSKTRYRTPCSVAACWLSAAGRGAAAPRPAAASRPSRDGRIAVVLCGYVYVCNVCVKLGDELARLCGT